MKRRIAPTINIALGCLLFLIVAETFAATKPSAPLAYIKINTVFDADDITWHDDTVDIHKDTASLRFLWPRPSGVWAPYYEFFYRLVGETEWTVETLDNNENRGYLPNSKDLDAFEVGVRLCNPAGCAADTMFSHTVKMDFREMNSSSVVNSMSIQLNQDGRLPYQNYCFADPDTLKCSALYVQFKAKLKSDVSGRFSFYDGHTFLGRVNILRPGTSRASTSLRVTDLAIGTHSIHLHRAGTSYTEGTIYARKRFYVYLPTTGAVESTGCEIAPNGIYSCDAYINWQFDGMFPTCLYKIDGENETQVACAEEGPYEASSVVTLSSSPSNFEIRADEPAGQRVVSTLTVGGKYQNVSLMATPERCDIVRPATNCPARVTWEVSDDYTSCLFNNDQLLICSNNGAIDMPVTIGGAHFTLRNGVTVNDEILSQANVRGMRPPTGTMKIKSNSTNPCVPLGGDSCDVDVVMEHWGSSGTILYKDDVNWGDLSSSANTVPVEFTHLLTAEAGGTHYSMRSMYDGELYEFASIDLYPSSSYPGYSLVSGDPDCIYNPLNNASCASDVHWSMPEPDACIFLNDYEEGFCPDETMLTGTRSMPRAKGTYRYQLRKGNTRDSELLAEVVVSSTEETVSFIGATPQQCTVFTSTGQSCKVTLNFFSNETEDFCLYRHQSMDNELVELRCGLTSVYGMGYLSYRDLSVGVNSYRIIEKKEDGELVILASTEVHGVPVSYEMMLNNSHCVLSDDNTCASTITWSTPYPDSSDVCLFKHNDNSEPLDCGASGLVEVNLGVAPETFELRVPGSENSFISLGLLEITPIQPPAIQGFSSSHGVECEAVQASPCTPEISWQTDSSDIRNVCLFDAGNPTQALACGHEGSVLASLTSGTNVLELRVEVTSGDWAVFAQYIINVIDVDNLEGGGGLYSGECSAIRTTITGIQQDDYGNVIMYVEPKTNCSCSPEKMTFTNADGASFFTGAAFNAFIMQYQVDIKGEEQRDCTGASKLNHLRVHH